MRDRARALQGIASQLRVRHPDQERFVFLGLQDGRAKVAKPHWPAGSYTLVPFSFGFDDLSLLEGASALVGFEEGNRQLPFLKSVLGGGLGKVRSDNAFVPVLGLWDQTWANWFQDARSKPSTAPASLTATVAYQYESDQDGPGVHWCPEGLLLQKDGKLWHVSLFTDLAEFGFQRHKIVTRLLSVASTPYSVSASAELELVGLDRTLPWRYPDGTAFYNFADDVLTVLVAPTLGSLATEPDYDAKIWTLRPPESGSDLIAVVQSVAIGDSGARRSWANVGQVGRTMVLFDLPHKYVQRWILNASTLEWQDTGVSTFWGGQSVAAPGRTDDGRNYSPPYTQGKFYSVYARRTESSNPIEYRLREVSFAVIDLAQQDVELEQFDAVDRSDPLRLSINDAYAAQVLANAQANALVHFPASGTYEETSSQQEQSFGHLPGGPFGESATFNWTRFTKKTWHGALYDDVLHSWTSGGPEVNYPAIHFPVPTFFASPSLTADIGGVPLPAAGCPLPGPNRSWFSRAFWHGQKGDNVPWNLLDTSDTVSYSGNVPYHANVFNGQSQARGLATADGWRFWVSVSPDTPVFVPNTIDEDGNRVNPGSGIVSFHFTANTLKEYLVTTGTMGSEYTYYAPKEDRYFSGVVPVVRWTFRTRFYAISPTGQVFAKTISEKWTNLPYPGLTVGGVPTDLLIAEELSVAENAYQIVSIPRHNQIGILCDQRTSGTSDPEPMLLVLTRAENSFNEVYRIPASAFLPPETLEIWDANQEHSGEVWARAGQYKYTLHGWDETGPQCKVLERATETLLLVGHQAVERVAPDSASIGHTTNGLSLFRLLPDGYQDVAALGTATTWIYGGAKNGADDTFGPRVVRSAVISDDRVIYACNTNDGPALRQIA